MPEERQCSVSIIVVSHNRPKYLTEALDSIFKQTIDDWEIIIVENSDPDNEARRICREAEKDSRIRVIYHDRNVDNIAACWNEALDVMNGRYWATLDDDNRKCDTFCEEAIRCFESDSALYAVVSGSRNFGDHTGIHIPNPIQIRTLRKDNFIDSGEIVYRRETLEKVGYFDERMVSQEDWDYTVRFFGILGVGAARFLNRPLSWYRWHSGKRMLRSMELKMLECAQMIKDKQQSPKMRVQISVPAHPELTVSQQQVADGVRDGLSSIPFVEVVDHQPEIVLLLGPLFRWSRNQIRQIRETTGAPIAGLLIEDPQALIPNADALDLLDWIVTNDANAYKFYRNVFRDPDRVYLWNCLSITNAVHALCRDNRPEKTHDICLVGYPYPSRVELIRQIRAQLPNVRLALVGDTWDKQRIRDATVFPTIDAEATARIGMASRIILLSHRTEEDCGGFPAILPGSVNRGYVEAAYRALLLIDNRRALSSFNGEVEWYGSADEAAEKIRHYLSHPDELNAKADAAYALAHKFTYQSRMEAMLQGFRAPRFNLKIQ